MHMHASARSTAYDDTTLHVNTLGKRHLAARRDSRCLAMRHGMPNGVHAPASIATRAVPKRARVSECRGLQACGREATWNEIRARAMRRESGLSSRVICAEAQC